MKRSLHSSQKLEFVNQEWSYNGHIIIYSVSKPILTKQ